MFRLLSFIYFLLEFFQLLALALQFDLVLFNLFTQIRLFLFQRLSHRSTLRCRVPSHVDDRTSSGMTNRLPMMPPTAAPPTVPIAASFSLVVSGSLHAARPTVIKATTTTLLLSGNLPDFTAFSRGNICAAAGRTQTRSLTAKSTNPLAVSTLIPDDLFLTPY
jgi:hypothetical protein